MDIEPHNIVDSCYFFLFVLCFMERFMTLNLIILPCKSLHPQKNRSYVLTKVHFHIQRIKI